MILLSVLHIFWLERDIYRQPLIYAAIVGVLLMLRLPPVRRASPRPSTRVTRINYTR